MESHMQDLICELIHELEPEGVQASINLMATATEMPATMEIVCSNLVRVCNTAESDHFAKSKDGLYNCRKTDDVSQGMTGDHVEFYCDQLFLGRSERRYV